jgi:hypothetical protein
MLNDSSNFFTILTICSVGFGVAVWLRALTARSRRRTVELETTAKMLARHYAALDAIADDPALPTKALEMVTYLSEAISDRGMCEELASAFLSKDNKKSREPEWFGEMEQLAKSRPDLFEKFNTAVASGLAAAFLRWPSTATRFYSLVDVLTSPKEEAALAEKVSLIGRRHHKNGDNGAGGGVLVPV